ncbi:hypothetical protein MPTK1_3g18670 [Marchantia polymorpha subsp. ruderalis]|uniref:Uncharacterized protein n=4 Tax=Marchantia polymorpha TaxID=3197 RepID=A0AAF6B2A0_MARPO|nr:hypothetical protein MARPO_0142s0027 [Marchantia polymorpha]BBN06134.1 hypothetical protein Mp_3g18670 [Marchantia polymorpha subsp. ruderalis]|eukprot:PTQ29399.1 hypothetical protein MARPO_0142s0027 [Marchantia polymorpha]
MLHIYASSFKINCVSPRNRSISKLKMEDGMEFSMQEKRIPLPPAEFPSSPRKAERFVSSFDGDMGIQEVSVNVQEKCIPLPEVKGSAISEDGAFKALPSLSAFSDSKIVPGTSDEKSDAPCETGGGADAGAKTSVESLTCETEVASPRLVQRSKSRLGHVKPTDPYHIKDPRNSLPKDWTLI